nr:hypothetical protein BdHM001_16640 [Bdellovibrio sp. HM001]
MGVGFLHGVLPQGISRSYFVSPIKVQVLTTDEILFPESLRQELEEELHVRFSVTVTRDWESMLANVVASPSADLIFLPSYWANTLAHQSLLANTAGNRGELLQRVASDFVKSKKPEDFYFLPFYWIKTGIDTPLDETFLDFLKNKKESFLFLLADEDLLLKHFQVWKEQGLWDQVSQKRILTLQLDQLSKTSDEGAVETPLNREFKESSHPYLSALLIWGAAIPVNSTQKEVALEILETLTSTEHQEKSLLKTPFNSTFSNVTATEIPLHRRADFIRDLQLKDTLILESKDQEAPLKLKNDFNFTL